MTLSSSTGKLASSTVTSLAQRTANNGAIEASVIYKHGSFYYLFTSWDNCCQGTSSTYNIRVGRSSKYVKLNFTDGCTSGMLTWLHSLGLPVVLLIKQVSHSLREGEPSSLELMTTCVAEFNVDLLAYGLLTYRFLQIVGPGGQDLMDDNDGPILVYRKPKHHPF